MSTDTYPEHEKLAKISDESQSIGEFLVWLGSQEMTVGQWVSAPNYREDQLVPTTKTISDLLATYFEIDQAKIEAEKRQMLESLRSGR